MELLKIIKEEDVYRGIKPMQPTKWTNRKAARAVVFDKDNNVGILHASKNNYYKLPGGGIEGSETIEEALERECLEEIGCKVIKKGEVGRIIEYRNKIGVKQESYCYIAEVDGEKGNANLEQDEIDEGFRTLWVDIYKAIELVKNSKPSLDVYNGPFMVARDLIFLNKTKEIKK